jgi:hypothetical protein
VARACSGQPASRTVITCSRPGNTKKAHVPIFTCKSLHWSSSPVVIDTVTSKERMQAGMRVLSCFRALLVHQPASHTLFPTSVIGFYILSPLLKHTSTYHQLSTAAVRRHRGAHQLQTSCEQCQPVLLPMLLPRCNACHLHAVRLKLPHTLVSRSITVKLSSCARSSSVLRFTSTPERSRGSSRP